MKTISCGCYACDLRLDKLTSSSVVQRPAGSGHAMQQTSLSNITGAQPRNRQSLDENESRTPGAPLPGIEANPGLTSNLHHVPWSDLLDSNYIPIIDHVHLEETNRKHTLILETPLEKFRVVCARILSSMYDEVLKGLVDGNLAKRYAQGDKVLVKVFGEPASSENTTWMKNAEGTSPSLYGRTLVDKEGNPPRPDQKRAIVQLLRRYISRDFKDIDIALEIDAKPPDRRKSPSTRDDIFNGNHTFLANQGQRIDARVARVNTFCDSAEAILRSPLKTKLANAAWFYIGWSMVPMDRLRSYDTGKSSFLLALVARVCEVLFPGKFRIENFILAYLASEEESAFGEILLTGIAGAYHQYGTGFCIHPAGMNNQSAMMDTLNQREAKRLWEACQTWREDNTPYFHNRLRLNNAMRNKPDFVNNLAIDLEAKRNPNLVELRAERDLLRPDYEALEKRLTDELEEMNEEMDDAMGDFAAVYRDELQRLLQQCREDAAEWETSAD
jgi:hypothetical protein